MLVMANGCYELKKGQKYSFNLKAANHQVILSSQTYESKESALGGIASVQANGAKDELYERKTAQSGQPFFVLKAPNGQVIGQSEMYETEAARDNGIESVKSNSPSTQIKDLIAS